DFPDGLGKRALKEALAAIATADPQERAPSFSIRRLRRRDWAHSWKLHFKPIELGSRLLIKPSWNRRRPKPGQKVVILDPGLSFGTGQHPTTLFCLREVVRRSSRRGERSL